MPCTWCCCLGPCIGARANWASRECRCFVGVGAVVFVSVVVVVVGGGVVIVLVVAAAAAAVELLLVYKKEKESRKKGVYARVSE